MQKPASFKRPVFLMGLPGCGKSTLGRALRDIGYEFTDIDEAVERSCGMTVADIIRRNGIDHFRRLEAGELRRAIDSAPDVVACGGGTPCHDNNMALMNSAGTTVLLSCRRDRLVRRLAEAGELRPMFGDIAHDPARIEHKINELEQSRQPYYSQATATFDSTYLENREEIDNTVAEFIKKFKQ